MKAIFAPGHLQSDLHLGETEGRRLEKFINLLAEYGVEASFPSSEDLETQIVNADLIIATTRRFDFSDSELTTLVGAVKTGRSLLHLSNHRPFPLYDSPLAERLGYKFKNRCFIDKNQKMPFEFAINLGALPNCDSDSNIQMNVSINNCSSIEVQDKRFNTISVLPESCVRAGDGVAAVGEVFAIACEKSNISGRIIAMGDSGLLGEPIAKFPGPGLEAGENYAILCSITKWLVS